jgi:ABC-type glycerol-3-phosphate transport system permease component
VRLIKARRTSNHESKIISPYAFALVLGAFWLMPISAAAITIGKPAPDIVGEPWINSRPLTIDALKGRVILVEFWTHG